MRYFVAMFITSMYIICCMPLFALSLLISLYMWDIKPFKLVWDDISGGKFDEFMAKIWE